MLLLCILKNNLVLIFWIVLIHKCLKIEHQNTFSANYENAKLFDEKYLVSKNISINTNLNIITPLAETLNCKNNTETTPNYSEISFKKNISNRVKIDEKRIVMAEYASLNREIEFYISRSTECTVSIKETVTYQKEYNINFIEHWILHNNVEDIELKSITSEDVTIKFYSLNKKMNIIYVYFDEHPSHTTKEFIITFQYEAINMIKTQNSYSTDNDTFFLEEFHPLNTEYSNFNYNSMIWKILNKNIMTNFQSVKIKMYFDLGLSFVKYFIFSENSNVHFTKKVSPEIVNPIVKYSWKGQLSPGEILIMDVKFPLYFETCKSDRTNLLVILLGAVFIILVVGMLHIVFSSVLFNDF